MHTSARIEKLEKEMLALGWYRSSLHGTSLSRQLCDIKILKKEEVNIPSWAVERESLLVWVLGLGSLTDPKLWVRGYTIEEVLTRAEQCMKNAREELEVSSKNKVKA